jgi:probable HAF family extracellular repeat protein
MIYRVAAEAAGSWEEASEMRAQTVRVIGPAAALVAIVLAGMLSNSSRLRAQDNNNQGNNNQGSNNNGGKQQPPRYTVTDLGPVGNPPGQPYGISNDGLVVGAAAASATVMHAVLWYNTLKIDIGAHGLGGPNSAGFGVNELGQVVGTAETSTPNKEDFCGFNTYGFPSFTACLPFVWQSGQMSSLPTLGGANGQALAINNGGEVAGFAETTNADPNPACPVSQFRPVIWERGQIHELPTYPGDADGIPVGINDKGQVVGGSGPCTSFNAASGFYFADHHALLWERDGSYRDLGNLGGSGGVSPVGNFAIGINNQGQVVGHSDLPDNTTFHAFLWTRETGMQDLGTLPGDVYSVAIHINDRGEVVGASLDANFNLHPVLWENGAAVDLNTLVVSNTARLTLQFAWSINSSGKIVGFAATSAGEAHGFLATPCGGNSGKCKDE